MNRTWLYTLTLIALTLLAILKAHNLRSLKPYYSSSRILKLENFEAARGKVSKEDLELLKLWESILTGRAAPLPKLMKERYRTLGLSHIFTPSGFHLSAVLLPFMKIIPQIRYQVLFLILIGIGLLFLPGFGALKRMVMIKTNQKLMGLHMGFILAMLMDIFFGSFQTSALSFTYSFLFLGIIYSGLQGISLIIWFFFGQIIISFFQGVDISPLLLLFSPLLNIGFAFLMPALFVLAIPLWDWQLELGLFLLKSIQAVVNIFAHISFNFPVFEIHSFFLFMLLLILMRRWKFFIISIFILSNSLNLDRTVQPGLSSKEFVPQGRIIRTVYDKTNMAVIFEDGRCRLKLVRGFWWESCSPKRGSSYRN